MFGGGSFNKNEKNEFKALNLNENNIIQVSGNNENCFLIMRAECLVITSLYEVLDYR